MSSFMETVYGPLSSDYCIYFYFLSVFGFVLLVFSAIFALFIGIKEKKKFEFYLQALTLCVGYGIFYFQNRLLYSMCSGSLTAPAPSI